MKLIVILDEELVVLAQQARDKFYIELAEKLSQLNIGDSTKVGACIVKNDQLLSIGHNQLITNFKYVPENNEQIELINKRNSYVYHAEQSAVFSYNGKISDFKGATVYLNISPCHECAKMLIGLGIKEIVYKYPYHREEMWNMSKILLETSGVKYRQYTGE